MLAHLRVTNVIILVQHSIRCQFCLCRTVLHCEKSLLFQINGHRINSKVKLYPQNDTLELSFLFSDFMLNKDKVDEVGTNLDAAKNERSLYIPRAVIKRLNSARFMPFGARNIVPDGTARNDDMANVLFYVVLNQQRAFAEPNEFK